MYKMNARERHLTFTNLMKVILWSLAFMVLMKLILHKVVHIILAYKFQYHFKLYN